MGFIDKTSNHEMSAIEEQAAGNATDISVEESTISDEDVGEMPPIVFMIDRQYVYAPGNGFFFLDNQGNLYFTNNPTVYELTYLELCEAFAEGELDDVIIHI